MKLIIRAGQNNTVVVAVDFDDTLFEYEGYEPFHYGKAHQELIKYLNESDFEVFVYTARPQQEYTSMKEVLDASGLEYRELVCGKERFDMLIDDKAINFDGSVEDLKLRIDSHKLSSVKASEALLSELGLGDTIQLSWDPSRILYKVLSVDPANQRALLLNLEKNLKIDYTFPDPNMKSKIVKKGDPKIMVAPPFTILGIYPGYIEAQDREGNVDYYPYAASATDSFGRTNKYAADLGKLAAMPSLPELEKLVEKLDLTLPEPPYGKKQVIDILSQYFWNVQNEGKDFPDFLSPQLIKNINELPIDKQDKIWSDPNWVAEKKINGVRAITYWGASPQATSRNLSLKDFLPEQLTSQVQSWLLPSIPELEGTTIDGEIASSKKIVDTRPFTKSKGSVTDDVLQAVVALLMVEKSVEAQEFNGNPLFYVMYDITKYKGENLKDKSLRERRLFLQLAYDEIKKNLPNGTRVLMTDQIAKGKIKFFEECIGRGEEGCVLKSLEGKYRDGPSRTNTQYKAKRQVEIDAVVTGFVPPKSGRLVTEGLVGGLVFSAKDVNDNQWHRVAAVSNLDWDFRREITIKNEDGSFKEIKPECYDWVFEIEGQEFNKNGQLSHARIARPRYLPGPDYKDKSDATYDLKAVLENRVDQTA